MSEVLDIDEQIEKLKKQLIIAKLKNIKQNGEYGPWMPVYGDDKGHTTDHAEKDKEALTITEFYTILKDIRKKDQTKVFKKENIVIDDEGYNIPEQKVEAIRLDEDKFLVFCRMTDFNGLLDHFMLNGGYKFEEGIYRIMLKPDLTHIELAIPFDDPEMEVYGMCDGNVVNLGDGKDLPIVDIDEIFSEIEKNDIASEPKSEQTEKTVELSRVDLEVEKLKLLASMGATKDFEKKYHEENIHLRRSLKSITQINSPIEPKVERTEKEKQRELEWLRKIESRGDSDRLRSALESFDLNMILSNIDEFRKYVEEFYDPEIHIGKSKGYMFRKYLEGIVDRRGVPDKVDDSLDGVISELFPVNDEESVDSFWRHEEYKHVLPLIVAINSDELKLSIYAKYFLKMNTTDIFSDRGDISSFDYPMNDAKIISSIQDKNLKMELMKQYKEKYFGDDELEKVHSEDYNWREQADLGMAEILSSLGDIDSMLEFYKETESLKAKAFILEKISKLPQYQSELDYEEIKEVSSRMQEQVTEQRTVNSEKRGSIVNNIMHNLGELTKAKSEYRKLSESEQQK